LEFENLHTTGIDQNGFTFFNHKLSKVLKQLRRGSFKMIIYLVYLSTAFRGFLQAFKMNAEK